MMTKEEIFKERSEWHLYLGEAALALSEDQAFEAMKEYAEEAIKHCASKITYPVYDFNGNLCNDRVKKVILKQIEELK